MTSKGLDGWRLEEEAGGRLVAHYALTLTPVWVVCPLLNLWAEVGGERKGKLSRRVKEEERL